MFSAYLPIWVQMKARLAHVVSFAGAKVQLFFDITKRFGKNVKKNGFLLRHVITTSKKPPAIKTNRDSFRDGLATVLHRALIPLWTGAPLISSLLGSYQHPIRSLSGLLARVVQWKIRPSAFGLSGEDC